MAFSVNNIFTCKCLYLLRLLQEQTVLPPFFSAPTCHGVAQRAKTENFLLAFIFLHRKKINALHLGKNCFVQTAQKVSTLQNCTHFDQLFAYFCAVQLTNTDSFFYTQRCSRASRLPDGNDSRHNAAAGMQRMIY